MNVHIRLSGSVNDEDSLFLKQLAPIIEGQCGVEVTQEEEKLEPGRKDGGLVIGLTVAGLVFTAIGTLIDILSFKQSQEPKYSLTFTDGRITFQLDNIPPVKLQENIEELKKHTTSKDVEILITRKS